MRRRRWIIICRRREPGSAGRSSGWRRSGVLGNDWVVRHDNRFYQVERQSRNHAPAKSTVVVCEWEDGTVEIHYRGRKLRWHEIEERPGKPEAVAAKRRKSSTPPAAHMPNHPWRRRYQDMQPRWPMGAPGSRHAFRWPRPPLRPKRSPSARRAPLRPRPPKTNWLRRKQRGHF